MTIVHIAIKAVSRKAMQSAVASTTYRAGVILKDKSLSLTQHAVKLGTLAMAALRRYRN